MDITEDSERWVGRDAYDSEGYKLGEISAIYHDDMSGLPEWVAIKSKGQDRLVPLAGATTHRRPDEDYDPDEQNRKEDLQLAFPAILIDEQPEWVVGEDGHLDPGVEQRIYGHFGMVWSRSGATTSRLRRFGRIGGDYA